MFKTQTKKPYKKYLLVSILIFAFLATAVLISTVIVPEDKTATANIIEDEPVPVSAPKEALAVPGDFELPIEGSTGFASVNMSVRQESRDDSDVIGNLSGGDAFMIVSEDGEWWEINSDGCIGYVHNKYCMINLPDIIPSIIYDNRNSYSSLFQSSGKELPGITGEKLYDAITYNERFQDDIPLMPVLYSMANKIFEAQKVALDNGDSLLIYESYRPAETQNRVKNALTSLMNSDSEVSAGINTSPWSKSWFISTGTSNHQKGGAIDVSLAKVEKSTKIWAGPYKYLKNISYTEYEMPTRIHELSARAATFTQPISSKNGNWRNMTLADSMNDASIKLQRYCTDSGLTPLASEWWHFDDWDALNDTSGNSSIGNYKISECFSTISDN